MMHTKYTPEVIGNLVDIAINSSFTLPEEHLINLFSMVNLGMFDTLQDEAKAINSKDDKAKSKVIFKELYELIVEDIEAFKLLPIEKKTAEFSQSRILEVPPTTYGKNELLMRHDRQSADMDYVYLTQPVRKRFKDKYKTLLKQLDELFI